MGDKPLHQQAADFVRDWMSADRDKSMRVVLPSNPLQKGPRDWYIGMGMVFGTFGLLQGGGETWAGLVGVAIGVGIVAVWNLVLFALGALLRLLFARKEPKQEPIKRASDGIDFSKMKDIRKRSGQPEPWEKRD
jgi:hypothetical protein